MKNKKGMEISVMIRWAVGIILLVVLVLIGIRWFGEAEEVDASIGKGLVPGGSPPPTSTGSGSVPEEVVDYFNYFAGLMGDNKDGERCLIPVEKDIPNLGNYFIELTPGKAFIKHKGGGLTKFVSSIPDFKPCVVAGDGAGNFHNNWIDGSSGSATPEYLEDDTEYSVTLNAHNRLIALGKEYVRAINFETTYFFLYKPDTEHICLIPAWGDIGPNCNFEKSENKDKGMDNDCFDKDDPKVNAWLSNVPRCETP
ncbi:hypothetical protein ACFLUF_02850 [Chloroflexota bacterium]